MKVVITGANGLLGQHLVTRLSKEGFMVFGLARGANRLGEIAGYSYYDVDLTDGVLSSSIIKEVRPDVIIHAAAMTQVDQCEEDKQSCYNINVSATRFLIDAAKEVGSRFVYVSTDFIFDGNNGPYKEEDDPAPVNYYGSTKLAAEKAVLESGLSSVIVRTVLVYGEILQGTRSNIIQWVKSSLEQGKLIKVVSDQYRTPTFIDDLVEGILLILRKEVDGIFHISGDSGLTPYDMALKTAEFFGLDTSLIQRVDSSSFQQLGVRPLRTGFNIDKAKRMLGYQPTSFDETLKKMFSS